MGKHGMPPTVTRYLTEKIPDHPTAQADGRVRIHRAVLFDKIGPGSHQCHWCGAVVTWFADEPQMLVADHLDENKWNNIPSNLVPACTPCNSVRRLRHRDACFAGHAYTEENTYRPARGGRQCRTCTRLREKNKARHRKGDA